MLMLPTFVALPDEMKCDIAVVLLLLLWLVLAFFFFH